MISFVCFWLVIKDVKNIMIERKERKEGFKSNYDQSSRRKVRKLLLGFRLDPPLTSIEGRSETEGRPELGKSFA